MKCCPSMEGKLAFSFAVINILPNQMVLFNGGKNMPPCILKYFSTSCYLSSVMLWLFSCPH
jgi:hypothetical protein